MVRRNATDRLMPDLLRPPERDRLISYLERQLLRPVTLGGTAFAALRETPSPLPGAESCRTAEAAAALELLALPGPRACWSGLVKPLERFLRAMGEGGLLLDRTATPGCVIDSIDPQDFRVLTGSHEFTGDLSRGVVRQEARGRAGAREFHHSGDLVEFRTGRRLHHFTVREGILRFGLVPQPDGVVLFHESELRAPIGLLGRPGLAAVLRYEYRIRGDDPRLQLRVRLTPAPGVALLQARVTLAVDQMAGGPRPLDRIVLRDGAAPRLLPSSAPDDAAAELHLGAADSLHLVEDAPPGQAAGLHLGFASGPLHDLQLTGRQGEPHWLLMSYRAARVEGGGALDAVQERLMTAGTLAGAEPAYAALLADPAPLAGRDPGYTADAGAVLNAAALRVALGGPDAGDWREWYDRHLSAFLAAMADTAPSTGPAPLRPARAGLRALCATLLSLDMLPDPTPEQRRWQDLGLDALLAAQDSDGTFLEPGGGAWLDCHAAAMLALARLAARKPEERIAQGLRRALAALRLGPPLSGGADGVPDHPLLRDADDGRWTFKPALLMRALAALPLAAEAVPLDATEEAARQALFDACFRLLRGRVRSLDGDLEVLTGAGTTEGNAATQPAAILALLSPDEAALGRVASPAEG